MSYYCFLHKSVKWWRKILFWMLEMTVENSYIIYQHTLNENKQKNTHLAFRQEIIEHVVEPILSSRLPTPILSQKKVNSNRVVSNAPIQTCQPLT